MRPPWCLFLPSPWNLRCRFPLVRDFEHRGLDGLENLKIARAPAQISGNRSADLIAAGVRIHVQQSLRRDQNRRRAIAALRRAEIGTSILQGMKVSVSSEASYSQYFCSTTLECQHETGKHGLAV